MLQVGGSWVCDVCMISNPADAMKCVACETPRPGAAPVAAPAPAEEETPAPSFQFGSSGGFKFGSGGEAEKPVSSGFTFGSSSPSSSGVLVSHASIESNDILLRKRRNKTRRRLLLWCFIRQANIHRIFEHSNLPRDLSLEDLPPENQSRMKRKAP